VRAAGLAAGALAAGAVFSSRLAVANPLFLLAAVAALVALRRGELAGRPWGRWLAGPSLLFVGASVVSALASQDPLTSVQQLPRLLVFALIPLAAALSTEYFLRFLAWGLAVVTSVLAVWGVWQYFHGFDSLAQRIRGPLSHYMTYAGWLLLAAVVLLGLALLAPIPGRWLLLVPVAAALAALALSFTRNAWVGFAAGVLALAACWRRRLLLVYPLLLLAVLLVFPRSVRERLFSTLDLRQHANYDRLCMLYSGLQMVRDHPFTGVGLDMVPKLYPLYRRDDAPRYRVPHLHNNPLQIAAERGLVALLAYLWLVGAFLVTAFRTLPRSSGEARAWVAAAASAVVAITVAGLFEYNFWDAEIQYLTFVLMGAAAGLGERAA